VRTLLWFSLFGVIGLVVVIVAAPRLFEPPGASAVIAAAVICVVAGLIAMVPPALVAPRWGDYLMHAGLAAMLIRLFLTLGAGAVYYKVYAPPSSTFMGAIVVFYLVLLAYETGVTIRLVKQHWRPPPRDNK
jgi:hypothetical protein